MIKNQIKTVLLLGILTGILLVIGSFFGGKTGLTIGLGFAIVMNLFSYFYSYKLILFMYRAKEAKKSDYKELHEIVESVAKEAGVPKPKVYITPTESPNAFCAGPNPKKAVLCYTQGILKLLSKEELRGVTAHEIAHDKNRDILIATVAATIASVISYIAFMARFSALSGSSNREGGGTNLIGLILLGILAPLSATIIQLAISRSREYIADETGAKLVKKGEPLAKALEKLENYGKSHPMLLGSESTNNLFIVNPFRGKGMSFASIFSTHPPVHLRVKKLMELEI